MPPHTISSQRLFYRNLFSSPDNHQARTTIMRRFCSDRMCCLMSILLLFYIGWTLFNPSKRALRYEHDSSEQFAYVRALNTSSSMIQNAQLCSLDKVDLLLLIISSSSHFLERQAIRETWGSMVDIFDVHSQRLFVIGYHPNGDFYKDLTQEAAHERDLLYLTTNDYASTLKEIHAYQWLDQYCPNVSYIFKTEDDLFVNSLLLHELVRELRTNPSDGNDRYLYNTRIDALFAAQNTADAKHFLFGLAYIPGRPERNLTSSPYYVPHTEYSNEFYPRYCSGFGYLMNSPTKHALTVEALKDQHPFRFAAIYLTGIVPERLNFICELIPFNFHQGTVDRCVELIKTTNTKNPPPSTSPLLTCSTGRHVGQNSFADYYRLWTDLKHVYVDRLQVKGN